MFSCEFCEIFRNTFFYRTPLVVASEDTKNTTSTTQETKNLKIQEFQEFDPFAKELSHPAVQKIP